MNTTMEDPVKPSFFDDPVIEDYKLWKKGVPLKKPSETRLMEGILFKKSNRTNFWKSRFYVLYEDRLAYYKNGRETKEQAYCLIQNMRIDKIPQQNDKDDKYGIKLMHNRCFCELFARAKDVQEKWIQKLTQFCVLTNYSSCFVNVKTIGKGSFAKVYLARRKSDNVDLAVKTFDKSLLLSVDKARASLINEINIMRRLDHESIIKLYEVYESDNYIYLVVELLHGGELFERIVKKGQYGERDACVLMKKLLSSLNYMHAKGIMHRDIKPENLILKDPDNDGDVKIADFGLATYVNATEYLFKRCGTPGYVAPEILADEKYDHKVDVFSAGVILYILLTGGSPFHGKSYNEILWKNKNCEIKFNFKDYGHKISDAATDLMKKLLEKDPKLRISAEEALTHEWIQNDGVFLSPKSQAPIFLSSAQENMKKFQEQNRFNVKNIKPKDLDKTGLEKSIHAPSPLITGKLTEMADSRNQLMNSPDVRLGPGVTMKKASKFQGQVQQAGIIGGGQNGQTEESDDIDAISDEKTSINQNIRNYQNVGLNNIIGRMRDVNGVKPPESPNVMKKVVEQKTVKKAIGVQSNLLNFLKKNQPENQVQFTLNNPEKANNVKNILRDMEK